MLGEYMLSIDADRMVEPLKIDVGLPLGTVFNYPRLERQFGRVDGCVNYCIQTTR